MSRVLFLSGLIRLLPESLKINVVNLIGRFCEDAE